MLLWPEVTHFTNGNPINGTVLYSVFSSSASYSMNYTNPIVVTDETTCTIEDVVNSSASIFYQVLSSVSNPPSAPSNLDVVVISNTQIDLSWQDNSSDEAGFVIERKIDEGGVFSIIDSVAADVNTYSDITVSERTSYYYRVYAYNDAGNSDYSNTAIGNIITSTSWEFTYGGTGNEEAYCVKQTSDGGYVVVGYSESYTNGDKDVWLLKLDVNGNEEWSQNYGGVENDVGNYVQQTDDGGYIIAGNTESFSLGDQDYYLIKTDASGNEEWYQHYNYTTAWAYAECVEIIPSTGYAVLGASFVSVEVDYQFWLVITDEYGNLLEEHQFGGQYVQYGHCLKRTSDEGIIMMGRSTIIPGNTDFWMVKVDENYNEMWNANFGGTFHDYGYSVQETSDGGFVGAGKLNTSAPDLCIVRTNASGGLVWENAYGGTGSDYGQSVAICSDGGYAVAGYSNSFGNSNDVYLVKVNSSGELEWEETYGDTGDDKGYHIEATSDGGLIIAGCFYNVSSESKDFYVIKLD